MKSKKSYWLTATVVIFSFFTANLDAQVTIGESVNPDAQAVLDLKSKAENRETTGAKGLLLPRVTLKSKFDPTPFTNTTAPDTLTPGMTVYNKADNLTTLSPGDAPLAAGLYVWTGNEWISANSDDWFYMPSTTINTEFNGLPKPPFDLYQVYADQFNPPAKKSLGAPDLFVQPLARTDFYYYVIGYTSTVFNIIQISANGIMDYDIIDVADENTYINVVFVKKH
jgi:hypothetical protein